MADGPSWFDGGDVGIGTTNPQATLDVNGDIILRGEDIKDAGGTSRIKIVDNGELTLSEDNGTEVLRVATNGYVGIDNTTPSYKLDVYGDIRAYSGNIMSSNGNIIASNGYVDVDGARIISGAGNPENGVSAPVGSLYLNTSGGSGTTLYVKESGGTGNTGWVGK